MLPLRNFIKGKMYRIIYCKNKNIAIVSSTVTAYEGNKRVGILARLKLFCIFECALAVMMYYLNQYKLLILLFKLRGLCRRLIKFNLNVVSATFLLVCLKESTCETKKNVLYFTSKALFVIEKIKFSNFRYSNFMTSSNV